MLGYRHAFHAGNHGDVLKHVVLLQLLEHLRLKDRAFWYIDTHAGAGHYDLRAELNSPHGEYHDGAGRLRGANELPQALQLYADLLVEANPHGSLTHYPGSPWIARSRRRDQDRLWLHELHPADYALLAGDFADHGCTVRNTDGFGALKSLLPPAPRRALVLIDPSYELGEDYARLLATLKQAVRRFATGVYQLWYPLIARREALELPTRLEALGAPRWLRAELTVSDAAQPGLHGSGVFVINPPWTLQPRLAEALPRLVELLGRDRHAGFHLSTSAG